MRLTSASAQKILPFIQVDFSGSECFFFTASTFSPMTIRFPQKLNKNSFFINIVGSRWFFFVQNHDNSKSSNNNGSDKKNFSFIDKSVRDRKNKNRKKGPKQ